MSVSQGTVSHQNNLVLMSRTMAAVLPRLHCECPLFVLSLCNLEYVHKI